MKSVRIRSFSGPNAGKYGPEKLWIRTHLPKLCGKCCSQYLNVLFSEIFFSMLLSTTFERNEINTWNFQRMIIWVLRTYWTKKKFIGTVFLGKETCLSQIRNRNWEQRIISQLFLNHYSFPESFKFIAFLVLKIFTAAITSIFGVNWTKTLGRKFWGRGFFYFLVIFSLMPILSERLKHIWSRNSKICFIRIRPPWVSYFPVHIQRKICGEVC